MVNILKNLRKRLDNNKTFRPYRPDRDSEIDRAQIHHHLINAVWGNNYSAPVQEKLKKGARVLDVGCGPGTWICDMASDYKNSTFFGIDILPIFPTERPFNAFFKIGNVLNGLKFSNESFDFVHMSLMGLWLTQEQYEKVVLPELIRLVKPGGWIEIMEPELEIYNAGPRITKAQKKLQRELKKQGRDPLLPIEVDRFLHSSYQLTNVTQKRKECAVGIGPSDLYISYAAKMDDTDCLSSYSSSTTTINANNSNSETSANSNHNHTNGGRSDTSTISENAERQIGLLGAQITISSLVSSLVSLYEVRQRNFERKARVGIWAAAKNFFAIVFGHPKFYLHLPAKS
ncbi:2893_t:CDS:2 [Ambispora leptoticha]|uniref:2893_t:CDS:1 n=1 Tax=Ambispora leptoticha TaxID=144679 RepID=A0A9N8WG57_9GLOM|nr:2893_t:CDS:2 [Ambispora leptoticha]